MRRQATGLRAPPLAVALGLYLPLELSTPIFCGGLVAWLITRTAKSPTGNGILLAAGLIAGEALAGICMAVPIVMTGNPAILAAPADWQLGQSAGIVMLAGVIFCLWRFARAR